MNLNERIGLAASHVAGRTLTQGHWRKHAADGAELVCLLAAFGPDINDPANCPVELMPDWLARLLPQINDGLPGIFFDDFAAAFVGLAGRWSEFDEAMWAGIHKSLLIEMVWYTNALVGEADQEAGHAFGHNRVARKRLDALLLAARNVVPALYLGRGRTRAIANARTLHAAEKSLHRGLAGRERRVVIAAHHAVHAAYRAAEGSAADTACQMARVATLVDTERHASAAWRHVAAVLLRLLGKDAVQ